jgi:peroxin-11B
MHNDPPVMRIGKPVEHLQAAVKGLDLTDPVLKFTTIGRQLGYAGYLVNDTLVWVSTESPVSPERERLASDPTRPEPGRRAQLHSAKVRPFAPATFAAIQQRAARLWFTGIAFSIVSSVYKLYGLQQREQAVSHGAAAGEKDGAAKADLRTIKT